MITELIIDLIQSYVGKLKPKSRDRVMRDVKQIVGQNKLICENERLLNLVSDLLHENMELKKRIEK